MLRYEAEDIPQLKNRKMGGVLTLFYLNYRPKTLIQLQNVSNCSLYINLKISVIQNFS